MKVTLMKIKSLIRYKACFLPFLFASLVFSQNAHANLTQWFSNGLTGKTICFVGDSTTSNATPLFNELNNFYMKEGEPLHGVSSILNYGENGASLSAFLSNSVTYGITAALSAQADLYVISYGINDVRLGQATEDQLVYMLKRTVFLIQASVPNSDIILRMPNSLLSDDINGYGYVQPNANAPVYSTILRNAYKRLENKWDNVVVFDAQGLIFGRESPSSSVHMADQLHPSSSGYTLLAKALVELIGVQQNDQLQYKPASLSSAILPVVTSYYNLVATGRWVSSSEPYADNGYIDFSWPKNKSNDIHCGDLLQLPGNYVFRLPETCSPGEIGKHTRIFGLGSSIPPIKITGGTINVLRPKYNTIASGQWLASSVAGVANGYMDFAWPQDRSDEIQCGDHIQVGDMIFTLPPTCRLIPFSGFTRIYNLGATLPPATIAGGMINVWRVND